MWKTLRNRVGNSAKPDRKTNNETEAKQTMADIATAATKTNTQAKKTKINGFKKKKGNPEDKEMKEVLHLFNHLEELILDGDPRIKEILDHKPLVQLALNDDGDVTDRSEFSPRRPYVPKLALGTARDPSFVREISGVSGRLMDRKSTRPDFGMASPRRDYTLNRFKSDNVILQQPIPEHQTLSNTYTIPNTYGRVRRQPDGTLLTTNEPEEVQHVAPIVEKNEPKRVPPAFLKPNISSANLKPIKSELLPEKHTFKYDTGQGESKVEVTMTGNDTAHGFNYTNPEAGYKVNISLDNLPKPQNEAEEEPVPENPETRRLPKYKRATSGWAEAASKVITSSGGEVSCYDCKIEVPKDAVNKSLFRIVMLDAHVVPSKGVRQALEEGSPALIPITPVIRVEPIGMKLNKPITVTLPTCIGVRRFTHGNKIKTSSSLEKEIKASDLTIKRRGYASSEWTTLNADVMHKGSTVVFQISELSDLCVLHSRKNIGDDPLTKRFCLYVFKSMEERKKQFLSILVCEDQPHVLQKGIEGMPSWLQFTDSCVNVRLQEGENMQVILQSEDRTICSVDANKMEIPWENLWKPECIIKKNFQVTMKKVGVDCSVKVSVGDLNSDVFFKWEVRPRPIFLPEPIPVENYSLERDDELLKLDQVLRQGSNIYKHVYWKPATPTPPNVTNDTLLQFATM